MQNNFKIINAHSEKPEDWNPDDTLVSHEEVLPKFIQGCTSQEVELINSKKIFIQLPRKSNFKKSAVKDEQWIIKDMDDCVVGVFWLHEIKEEVADRYDDFYLKRENDAVFFKYSDIIKENKFFLQNGNLGKLYRTDGRAMYDREESSEVSGNSSKVHEEEVTYKKHGNIKPHRDNHSKEWGIANKNGVSDSEVSGKDPNHSLKKFYDRILHSNIPSRGGSKHDFLNMIKSPEAKSQGKGKLQRGSKQTENKGGYGPKKSLIIKGNLHQDNEATLKSTKEVEAKTIPSSKSKFLNNTQIHKKDDASVSSLKNSDDLSRLVDRVKLNPDVNAKHVSSIDNKKNFADDKRTDESSNRNVINLKDENNFYKADKFLTDKKQDLSVDFIVNKIKGRTRSQAQNIVGVLTSLKDDDCKTLITHIISGYGKGNLLQEEDDNGFIKVEKRK